MFLAEVPLRSSQKDTFYASQARVTDPAKVIASAASERRPKLLANCSMTSLTTGVQRGVTEVYSICLCTIILAEPTVASVGLFVSLRFGKEKAAAKPEYHINPEQA